jgi:hypothetical protein
MPCPSTANVEAIATQEPPARSAPFEDAFLRKWIDAQLGDMEKRGIVHLRVALASGGAGDKGLGDSDLFSMAPLDIARDRIKANGGVLLPSAIDEISAVWCFQRGDREDQQQALETALAISLDGRGRTQCLLDLRLGLVSKSDPTKVQLARASNSVLAPGAITRLPVSIIITRTFRSAACLEGGLVVLGAGDGEVLYGLSGTVAGPAVGRGAAQAAQATWTGPADGLSYAYMERLNRIDQLGDLKPVVIAAAIAGSAFPTTLLAGMLDIDPARLEPALTHAVRLGIIVPATSGPRPTKATRTLRFRRRQPPTDCLKPRSGGRKAPASPQGGRNPRT